MNNYIILAGKPSQNLQGRHDYYGEKIVLEAPIMGLNTYWVELSFNKSAVKKLILAGEKMVLVTVIGYRETQGTVHKGKTLKDVIDIKGEVLDWFQKDAEAALLTPMAINQQKFRIGIKDGNPIIRIAGIGPYTEIDLGIMKYSFEAAFGYKVK